MEPLGFILKVQTLRNNFPCYYYPSLFSSPSFLCCYRTEHRQLLPAYQITCNYLIPCQFLCTTWSHSLECLTQLMDSYMSFIPILWPSPPEASLTCPPSLVQAVSLPLFSEWQQPWACMDIPSHSFTYQPPRPPAPHKTVVSLKEDHASFTLVAPAPGRASAHSETIVGLT